jgi:CHAD domain-containing protein
VQSRTEPTWSGTLRPADIDALLPPSLRATPGRQMTLRRTWVDTPDGKLARKGISLMHVNEGWRGHLVLHDVTGTTTELAGAEPPVWSADLPPATARHIAAFVGLRVLIPVRSEESSATVLALLNRDSKTVGRVWFEHGHGDRVRLQALRGYEAQTAALEVSLAADERLQPFVSFEPKRPPMPRRPPITGAMPAMHAVASVLTYLLDVIEWNVAGATARLDTEFLRELRVAVRRSRTALKLTATVLPSGFVDEFGPSLSWIGDLTTPARDLDVLVLMVPQLAAALPVHVQDDLEPLEVMLTEQNTRAYAELGTAVHSTRFADFVAAYRRALADVIAAPAGPPLAAEAAAQWAAAAMRRVVRQGSQITEASPPESLHDLRKVCKELRYCLQLFEPLWVRDVADAHDDKPGDDVGRREFVVDLKALQDNLGVYQDSDVQSATLRRWAESADTGRLPAATGLAIGRLSVHLEAAQAAARATFAERFKQFTSSANRRRFTALIGSEL